MKADVQTLCTPSWRSTMININRTQEVGVVLRLQVTKEELNRAQEVQEVTFGGSPNL